MQKKLQAGLKAEPIGLSGHPGYGGGVMPTHKPWQSKREAGATAHEGLPC